MTRPGSPLRGERALLRARARGADPQIPRHVDHRPTGLDQVEHLAPELRRMTSPAHEPSSGVARPGFELPDSTELGADQGVRLTGVTPLLQP